MSALDDSAPIADTEDVYRRLPVSREWYRPGKELSFEAFMPGKEDNTGLSLRRLAFYESDEKAAQGPSKHGYYIAVIPVAALRAKNISVDVVVDEDVPGHVELPQITFAGIDEPRVAELARTLALATTVRGPFHIKCDCHRDLLPSDG